MKYVPNRPLAAVLALVSPLAMAALTGCGLNPQEVATGSLNQSMTRSIMGHVHGGAFPIRGATVTLMRTQTGTYGTGYNKKNSTYGSTALALGSTTSDNNGNFTFDATDDYNCPAQTTANGVTTPGEYVYIVVTGGLSANDVTSTVTPSSNPNNNVVQVAAVGSCSFMAAEYSTLEVFVSELTTVAAAYALNNFMTVNDSTTPQVVNIGAPLNNSSLTPGCTGTGPTMTCTSAGLAHAFQVATNLVNSISTNAALTLGTANATSPTNKGVLVPQAMINTIGNILQSCVDSLSSSSNCSTLFTDANLSGTAPKNTLEVAMQLAEYPSQPSATLSTLWKLQPQNAFFTPDLDAAPPSFTVALGYQKTYEGGPITYPVDIALDGSDNAYVLYGSGAPGSNTATGITAFDVTGVGLWEVANNSYGYPSQIAVDVYGNVYTTNNSSSNGAVLHATSSSKTLAPVASLANASGVAVDTFGDLWVSPANTSGATFNEYKYATVSASTGTATPDFSSNSVGVAVGGIAVDLDQDVWASAGNTAVFLNNSGGNGGGSQATPEYTASGYLTQTLTAGAGASVAVSGGNTTNAYAYYPVQGGVNYISATSSTLTLGPAGTATASKVPTRSVVDGSGNVWWTDNEGSGQVWQYVPSAKPASNAGTSGSFVPCFPVPDGSQYRCFNSPANYLNGTSVDSAGNLWVASSQGATVFEILGVASPTWPLLSYNHPGAEPK